jgi:hypothetical protein
MECARQFWLRERERQLALCFSLQSESIFTEFSIKSGCLHSVARLVESEMLMTCSADRLAITFCMYVKNCMCHFLRVHWVEATELGHLHVAFRSPFLRRAEGEGTHSEQVYCSAKLHLILTMCIQCNSS